MCILENVLTAELQFSRSFLQFSHENMTLHYKADKYCSSEQKSTYPQPTSNIPKSTNQQLSIAINYHSTL